MYVCSFLRPPLHSSMQFSKMFMFNAFPGWFGKVSFLWANILWLDSLIDWPEEPLEEQHLLIPADADYPLPNYDYRHWFDGDPPDF